MIQLITSSIIFTTLIAVIIIKYGVQESISASYYRFKRKWVFSSALIAFSWPIMFVSQTPLIFLSGALITFVAIAANFNESKSSKRIHVISAIVSVISGILSLVIDYHQYYLVGGAVIVGLVLLKFTKNYIWWNEILAFGVIISYLIFIS